MQTKQFGKTDMQITPIGLGAWAIGGGQWESSWGPQDDQESIATIRHALDLGINWIDTAAVYGLGHSETVVGKSIKGRERPFIFTKSSLVWDEHGHVGHSLKADSLRREVEEGWSTLAALKQEGKVRHIGVSNFSVEQMQRAEKIAPVETLQPPYSLVHPNVEKEILPYCQQHQIGVIVYSPMASGLLTGKMTRARIANLPDDDWRKSGTEFQEPRLSRNLALANLLAEIGKAHKVTAGVVAIAWTLHNPAVTAAIVGSRHPSQVEETIAAAEFRLSESEYEQIGQFVAQHP